MLTISKIGKNAFSKQALVRCFSTLPNDPVICAPCRTPVGSFQKTLAPLSATDLGAVVVKETIKRSGANIDHCGEAFIGNVVSGGLGQAPARQAAIHGGLPDSTPCTTVNKVCASGMKAIMFAAQSIMLGFEGFHVAGGMESMSNAPYYLPSARTGQRYGHGKLIDGLLADGLWDSFSDSSMGIAGEDCAKKHKITREDQDDFAIMSYERAKEANESGAFDAEIVPVSVPQRRGDPIILKNDEEYTNVNFEKLRALKPAFLKGGTITAANSSTLSDGASAMIVTSAKYAKENGLTPIARIRGFGDAARKPIEFPQAPADAIPRSLDHAGKLTIKDIDYVEINEAFAVVGVANAKILGLDVDRLNIRGGGISLGHPIGCSGARIVTTLSHILQDKDASLGVAGICNGGGGASSIVLERL